MALTRLTGVCSRRKYRAWVHGPVCCTLAGCLHGADQQLLLELCCIAQHCRLSQRILLELAYIQAFHVYCDDMYDGALIWQQVVVTAVLQCLKVSVMVCLFSFGWLGCFVCGPQSCKFTPAPILQQN
jgi:hypothetical protein